MRTGSAHKADDPGEAGGTGKHEPCLHEFRVRVHVEVHLLWPRIVPKCPQQCHFLILHLPSPLLLQNNFCMTSFANVPFTAALNATLSNENQVNCLSSEEPCQPMLCPVAACACKEWGLMCVMWVKEGGDPVVSSTCIVDLDVERMGHTISSSLPHACQSTLLHCALHMLIGWLQGQQAAKPLCWADWVGEGERSLPTRFLCQPQCILVLNAYLADLFQRYPQANMLYEEPLPRLLLL